MKIQPRTEPPPRRQPPPEWNAQSDDSDKGRKHEAFESSGFGCDRRSMARAQRLDSKR